MTRVRSRSPPRSKALSPPRYADSKESLLLQHPEESSDDHSSDQEDGKDGFTIQNRRIRKKKKKSKGKDSTQNVETTENVTEATQEVEDSQNIEATQEVEDMDEDVPGAEGGGTTKRQRVEEDAASEDELTRANEEINRLRTLMKEFAANVDANNKKYEEVIAQQKAEIKELNTEIRRMSEKMDARFDELIALQKQLAKKSEKKNPEKTDKKPPVEQPATKKMTTEQTRPPSQKATTSTKEASTQQRKKRKEEFPPLVTLTDEEDATWTSNQEKAMKLAPQVQLPLPEEPVPSTSTDRDALAASSQTDTVSMETNQNEEDAEEAVLPENQVTPYRKPPVIKLQSVSETGAILTIAQGKGIITTNKISRSGRETLIQAKSPDDYRKMTRIVEEYAEAYAAKEKKRLQWIAFPLDEDRKPKLVLRGLPTNTTEKAIQEDMANQYGITCHTARNMSTRVGKRRPLPMFVMTLDQEDVEKAKRVTNLCHMKVVVEDLHKAAGPTQCFNCQGYHHAQNSCHKDPRCVKCGEEHHSKQCQRAREVKATCANCNGSHPANYRGCPRCPTWGRPPPQRSQQRPPPNRRQQATGVSYAQATQGDQPAQNNTPSNRPTLPDEEYLVRMVTNIVTKVVQEVILSTRQAQN